MRDRLERRRRQQARPAHLRRCARRRWSLEPEHVWYLGDTPGIDVEGARNAGLWPVVLDPYQLHLGADFDRVDTLVELAEVVTTVTGG